MASCDNCGDNLSGFNYDCSKRDGTFCTKCRLPESHDCMGLKMEKAERELKREAGESEAWFKHGGTSVEKNDQSYSDKISSNIGVLIMLSIAVILITGTAIILL